jgi:hypothetical protein
VLFIVTSLFTKGIKELVKLIPSCQQPYASLLPKRQPLGGSREVGLHGVGATKKRHHHFRRKHLCLEQDTNQPDRYPWTRRFMIEVGRALRGLDAAIRVLCAVAGVQSQAITVDRQMKRYQVPRIAFLNKMDRAGANPFRVVGSLREKLALNPILLQSDWQRR